MTVAEKSPTLGSLKIDDGRKVATAGANSFGREFAKKNKINGPTPTPNLSQAIPACLAFASARRPGPAYRSSI
jgi:hypothetical protein